MSNLDHLSISEAAGSDPAAFELLAEGFNPLLPEILSPRLGK
jgi:hypothetical protein